jgi:ribosome-binding ATPase
MRLGIIGLPQSGKTTLYNALTRSTQPTGMGGRMEIHTAVVDVPDPRVDRLSEIFKPKKTIYAKVTYADIAGLDGSSSRGGISGALLNQLTQMDGFIHVVRVFEDDEVPHPNDTVDPARDISMMDAEFILNDLIAVERKLERLSDERRKGGAGRDKASVDREIAIFEHLQTALGQEIPLRDIDISVDDEKMLSGFGFLSRKPVLIVLNLSEAQQPPEIDYPHRRSMIVPLQGKLEMEIAQLPPDEMQVFLEEYGIEEPSLNRMIRLSYDLLGLESFFTVGPDECRAWTVKRGATAPEAAGVIHTDLQKGFIRAEVISYGELVSLGGLNEAKTHGKLRLEGKEYTVHDGDVLNIRFAI